MQEDRLGNELTHDQTSISILTQSNQSKNLKRNESRGQGVNLVDKHLADFDVNRYALRQQQRLNDRRSNGSIVEGTNTLQKLYVV
ncbi:hypothetical protein PICMEDRAFT_109147 [Pichia membranifaciens NRRL Y-2026]|uniref:Uncharacterized protein n=1 Tax=Pichia membranifaciens NRRL Y-2026 TaxID=763406 RepID=A0A1E3NNJ0_9ASCO|nr:hypothetical protein PICMEDRAFT_109147 [Pichia membranifaciens NRRL Y-2026]ODQ47238.1 hypothetical protein PICMEDRAFT_109147 [Pichia membranifaciens NRRL Y-2026]